MKSWLEVLRLQRFAKNLVVVPAILPVLSSSDTPALVLALLILMLLSSGSYVLNGLVDVESDALHPLKAHRLRALSTVGLGMCRWLSVSTFGAGVTLSALCGWAPIGWALAFIVASLAYNLPPLRFKDRALADVFTESLNAPVRLLLAWSVVFSQLAPLDWALAFWLVNFGLMALKRHHELVRLGAQTAAAYRPVYQCYGQRTLAVCTWAPLVVSCVFLRPDLLGACVLAALGYAAYVWHTPREAKHALYA